MGRFLTNYDYFNIQNDQLSQIIQGNPARLYAAENTAMEFMTSFLSQRYDISACFLPVLIYSSSITYEPGSRIILDYNQFDITTTYNINNCVIYNKVAYQAKVNVLPGVFDITQWNFLGNQYDIFYGNILNDTFNMKRYYKVGDVVYWNGHNYICNKNSLVDSYTNDIQYDKYSQIPLSNVVPDSELNSTGIYWNNKTDYFIPINTNPQNTNYWTLGDVRNQMLVMNMTDLVVYFLHKSIAPQNIPELRVVAYKEVKKWLEMIAMGDINANLPEKQPLQGLKFRFGGGIARENHW